MHNTVSPITVEIQITSCVLIIFIYPMFNSMKNKNPSEKNQFFTQFYPKNQVGSKPAALLRFKPNFQTLWNLLKKPNFYSINNKKICCTIVNISRYIFKNLCIMENMKTKIRKRGKQQKLLFIQIGSWRILIKLNETYSTSTAYNRLMYNSRIFKPKTKTGTHSCEWVSGMSLNLTKMTTLVNQINDNKWSSKPI